MSDVLMGAEEHKLQSDQLCQPVCVLLVPRVLCVTVANCLQSSVCKVKLHWGDGGQLTASFAVIGQYSTERATCAWRARCFNLTLSAETKAAALISSAAVILSSHLKGQAAS